MIKRIITFFVIFLACTLPVLADTLPRTVSDLSKDTIGMYQMPKHIVIYSSPDTNSDIIFESKWDYKTFNSENVKAEDLFSVFIQSKELAYSQVTDYTDDWVEVIYNKKENQKGWLKTEELRFMPWRNFYNLYGRKYGVYVLKKSPDTVKNLHSATSDESQIIHKMESPQKIKLVVIKGNWALVTSVEHNFGISGYLKWRNEDGNIYAFPSIK